MANEIRHEGVVVSVQGTEARVRIVQNSACSGCQAKSMCTAAESKEKMIDCHMMEPLEVGDKVMVTVARRLGWMAVLLAFVLPFVLLMVSVWGLTTWLENEALGGTLGLCVLVPYYAVLAACKGKIQRKFDFLAEKSKG